MKHSGNSGGATIGVMDEMVDLDSRQHVLQACRDHDVKFIRLWFTDILGMLKSVAITIEGRVQKPNDSHHAGEVWRAAWLARGRTEIRLKKEQYDWLLQLLDRKLPLDPDVRTAKEKKDQGDEVQTIASHLYGLSEDSVRQALTTLPDRRKADPEEAEPSADQAQPVEAAA